MSKTETLEFKTELTSFVRKSLTTIATAEKGIDLPRPLAKLCSCSLVGSFLFSAMKVRTMVPRSSSGSNTSHAGLSSGLVSNRRARGLSTAAISSSSSSTTPFRLRLAKSLFLRTARSITRRQCASFTVKPSFTIIMFVSMTWAKISSTGLPKNSPKLFWLLKRICSIPHSLFSFRAAPIWWRPSQSRLFVSMLRTLIVVFFLRASAI
mmetsp:Transcript_54309/g.145387  ORF Transcript_54309/g.145387 Transcript_54309/m.145387 type:complete len:208 (-) Transcript_54309:2195-2818(-)